MTPNWQTYWQVFSAPWQQSKTEKHYLGLVTVAVMTVVMVIGLTWMGKASGLLMGLGLSSVFLSLLVWGIHISAVLRHNHPVHVRLVPGYLQAHRRVLLVVWLLAAGLQTPAVWAGLAAPPAALLPAELRTPFVALVVSATGLMILATVFRWIWLAALSLFIGPWLGSTLSPLLDVGTSAQEAAVAHAHLLGAALLAAFAWLLSHRFLRSGDAKHRAAHTLRAQVRQLLTMDPTRKTPSFLAPGRRIEKWSRLYSYPYLRYTRRLLQGAQPTPSSVMARVDLSLSGPGHWVKQVGDVAALLAVAFVVSVFVEWLWGGGWALWSHPGAMGGLLAGIALRPLAGLRDNMLRSQHAHGLLVLLPGCPHGAELNRALARRHLFQIFVRWVVILLAILAFPGNTTVRSVALLLWLANLPVLPFVIQDWTKLKVLRPAQILIMGGKTVIGLCIVLSAHYWLGIAVQWIALTAVIPCVGLLVWRWRKLAGYPQALPAGRLAL